jgi:hypothetical protein
MLRLWRVAIVVIGLSTIPLWIAGMASYGLVGDFGYSADLFGTAPSTVQTVTLVEPGTSAARAGLRDGDTIPFAALDVPTRVKLNAAVAGDTVRVAVVRDGVPRTVTLTAVAAPAFTWAPSFVWLAAAAVLNLALGLLLAARAWDDPRARIVASFLLIEAFSRAVGLMNPLGSHGAVAVLAALCTFAPSFIGVVTMYLTVLLAQTFSTARSPLFKALLAISTVVVAASAIGWPVVTYREFAGAFDARDNLFEVVSVCSMYLIAAFSLLAAFAGSRGADRSRLLWFVVAFVPYQVDLFVKNLPVAVAIAGGDLSFVHLPYLTDVTRFLELCLPVVLIYAVFVRRALDLRFVLNRVLVYGILSAAIVITFMALEFLLGSFLTTISRAESVSLQLALAVAVGFASRYAHGIVDRFVDRIFFAKAHEDEKALRRFAREAEVFFDEDDLLDRALDTVQEHSGASSVGIYILDEYGAAGVRRSSDALPGTLDVDDPAFVSLRRWNEPLDTHGTKTALPDGLIFPMQHHGRIIGGMFCGTKPDATAFSPDEREPLAEVAHGLAGALHVFAASSKSIELGARLTEMRVELAAINVTLAALGAKIELRESEGRKPLA